MVCVIKLWEVAHQVPVRVSGLQERPRLVNNNLLLLCTFMTALRLRNHFDYY